MKSGQFQGMWCETWRLILSHISSVCCELQSLLLLLHIVDVLRSVLWSALCSGALMWLQLLQPDAPPPPPPPGLFTLFKPFIEPIFTSQPLVVSSDWLLFPSSRGRCSSTSECFLSSTGRHCWVLWAEQLQFNYKPPHHTSLWLNAQICCSPAYRLCSSDCVFLLRSDQEVSWNQHSHWHKCTSLQI